MALTVKMTGENNAKKSKDKKDNTGKNEERNSRRRFHRL
jgi:hypothetical protein